MIWMTMMKGITTVKRTMTTTQRTIMTYQRTIQMWKISDGSKALTVHFGNDFEDNFENDFGNDFENDFEDDFEDDYWRHCHWGSLIRNLWMQQSDSPLPSSGNIQTKWKEMSPVLALWGICAATNIDQTLYLFLFWWIYLDISRCRYSFAIV